MKEKRLDELNGYLKGMDLPFAYPLVEALIREALIKTGDKADDIVRRIYGLSGTVPPGKEAPLLFEQLVFDLYKEQQALFDEDDEALTSPMRERLLTLLDRWMQLYDFLTEDPRAQVDGRVDIIKEMEELLQVAQDLLHRCNRPDQENGETLGELDFLTRKSEEALIRIMQLLDKKINPPAEADVPEEEVILTLKIIVPGLPEKIWRRLKVSGSVNLAQFHSILQKTMGWWDLYDHQFEQGGKVWKAIAEEADEEAEAEERFLLQALLEEEDDMLRYLYDMPDAWVHKVIVEKAEAVKEKDGIVLECLGGEGACPPEDCGGPEGYRMLLVSLKPGASAELKDDFSWVGEYDPSAFDIKDVNKELKELL